jgi:ribosome-binding factor A
MAEERARRFDKHLKRELGKIIFDFLDVKSDVLVTVTRVVTNPNLFSAVVFISIFPSREITSIIKKLNASIYGIQQELNKKLKVRPVPKIIFKLDKNPEEAAEIEKLLKNI